MAEAQAARNRAAPTLQEQMLAFQEQQADYLAISDRMLKETLRQYAELRSCVQQARSLKEAMTHQYDKTARNAGEGAIVRLCPDTHCPDSFASHDDLVAHLLTEHKVVARSLYTHRVDSHPRMVECVTRLREVEAERAALIAQRAALALELRPSCLRDATLAPSPTEERVRELTRYRQKYRSAVEAAAQRAAAEGVETGIAQMGGRVGAKRVRYEETEVPLPPAAGGGPPPPAPPDGIAPSSTHAVDPRSTEKEEEEQQQEESTSSLP